MFQLPCHKVPTVFVQLGQPEPRPSVDRKDGHQLFKPLDRVVLAVQPVKHIRQVDQRLEVERLRRVCLSAQTDKHSIGLQAPISIQPMERTCTSHGAGEVVQRFEIRGSGHKNIEVIVPRGTA